MRHKLHKYTVSVEEDKRFARIIMGDGKTLGVGLGSKMMPQEPDLADDAVLYSLRLNFYVPPVNSPILVPLELL